MPRTRAWSMQLKSGRKTESHGRTIAFLGDYLPRKCGIATFTSDLLEAVASRYSQNRCFAVPVTDIEGCYKYPDVVRFEIQEQNPASYRQAADFLNASGADVVSLQHEFGIFGGPAGSHLLPLLRELKVPAVTTLHTVLQKPNSDQDRVMRELIALSTRLVVMTERGRTILQRVYAAPADKIDIIPHGIPDVPLVAPDCYKNKFGVSGRRVLLTFGLLSPNKGIEHVLRALPQIVAEFPDVVYLVLGATHPNELRTRGESYREGLEAIVAEHQLENHVIFHNRFVELRELTEFIRAADIYVTPYLGEEQSTSGTLAYAFGAGKAVISTPYWHAAELLKDDRGVLVPFGDPGAIARETSGLLRDEARRTAMSDRAYQLGRAMIWSNTALLYARSFELARRKTAAMVSTRAEVRQPLQQPIESLKMNLDHLYRMTDSVGIFQHGTFTAPNLAEGYCTDDNARALIFSVLLEIEAAQPQPARSFVSTYAAFLESAFVADSGRFHNFRSLSGGWLDEHGSEDSHGRAIWALGTAVGKSRPGSLQLRAGQLFVRALPAVLHFTSPRAWAFSLIGIDAYLSWGQEEWKAREIRRALTQRMLALFDQVAAPDWTWFEESLTYDNAKLAEALIVTGRATGERGVAERGLQALRWLVNVQTAPAGHFRPVGSNGFYPRNGVCAQFDQQPLEAQATVSACLEAYRTTADPWWWREARRAFDWFLGRNDLGISLYCPQSGGCRDGLHPDRANENQGAESTLAFLLSRAEMLGAQTAAAPARRAGMATYSST